MVTLYFDRQTGCLTGINLGRPPTNEELAVDFDGGWPPFGYTYRYDFETGSVVSVPLSECNGSALVDDLHTHAVLWLSRTVRVPTRGAFGVPFDSKEDVSGMVLSINNGVPVLKPGRYHIWAQVTYAIVRRFSIVSRDLILTVNGRELLRNSVSIYTRGQFTQLVGPVNVRLREEQNAVGVLSEPSTNPAIRYYRLPSYPVVVVGGRSRTVLLIEKL